MICFFIAMYTSAIDTLHIIYIKSSYIYICVYVAGSTSIFFQGICLYCSGRNRCHLPKLMPALMWGWATMSCSKSLSYRMGASAFWGTCGLMPLGELMIILWFFFWIAYSNTSIWIVGTIDTPVEGRIRPSSLLLSAQAHLDDCLNYLGGCKYLDPPGRWESCQLMAR